MFSYQTLLVGLALLPATAWISWVTVRVTELWESHRERTRTIYVPLTTPRVQIPFDVPRVADWMLEPTVSERPRLRRPSDPHDLH